MTHEVVPYDAFGDLWNRIWPWIQFVDEYDDYLSRDEYPAPALRYGIFLVLIRSLRCNAATKELIDSTLGRWVVLGRAWRHFIDAKNEAGLNLVGYLLTLWHTQNLWKSADFEELVFGAGGTRTELASLALSDIRHFLPNADSPITLRTIDHICVLIRLAGNYAGAKDPDPGFQAALLSHGLVTAYTMALRAMCRSSMPEASGMTDVLVGTLIHIIVESPPMRLRESLRAGLLEIIFSLGHREALSTSLVALVKGVILPATVYRSVVAELHDVLPAVRDRDASAIFRDDVLLEGWNHLNEVVASRHRVAEEYKTGVMTVPRICDDLECAKICSKQDLKRCSRCFTAHYCSRICQRNDWRHGKHRSLCESFLSRRNDLSHISPGDRSFLRVLMHHEYTTRREEIAQKQHVFMEENNEHPRWMMFNFVTGSCEIEFIPLSSSYIVACPLDVERAAASLDEIQLHMIKILNKAQSRPWLIHVHLKAVEVDCQLES
ncbi:hypothetical protein C8R45DRAFT_1034197 [Mycena sanguinolenta]|nr:hypothetical protein C8R45DRAFT_1034197 [Mycena sanguinolenta]